MSICRKNNWDQTLERLVNSQINLELKAFHYYNALYSYFMNDSVGFPGLANYFKKSADEELEHARKFIDYQNTRGGIVNIDVIEKPNFSFDNSIEESILYQGLNLALDLEQAVYESIQKMYKNCNDPGLEDFLDDFTQEQLQGQYDLGVKLRQLKIIGKDGHGLVHFDNEMLK